ncbi:hypothetical protein JR316_0011682 [Psilocybe cubensis]|uniref:Uncharacterized protein n=2 Tax=Psilocybe cubensis TaxID=181762 RepID=A0A8H8CJU1_PSICU|nr:hypothetical protein JR316_0011682 [Psilocybe cubensis]KAH9476111.1 hypothetical protein JR316_0011682 [Psilocybe cubensis]
MSQFAIEDLNMLFHPTDLRTDEQKAIGTACRTFQVAHSDLHSSSLAEVYSAPAPKGQKGRVWWHSNDNDKIEHVTVRYNRRKGGDRCHVYRDGSGNMNPHKPKKTASRATSGQEEEVYDSDCTVELLEGEEPSED